MRIIDADALKENGTVIGMVNGQKMKVIPLSVVDNAPTVEPRIEYGTDGQPYRLFMSGGQAVPDTLQGWRYEKRPQGKWQDGYGGEYLCTNCLSHSENITPFCWHCGADMRGGMTSD